MLDDWLQIVDCLDPAMQVTEIATPVVTWGSVARTRKIDSLVSFYTADKNFSNLWKSPDTLVATGCKAAIEVNYTTLNEDDPETVLDTIYRKRVLSAYWQKHGIKILVDLNVAPSHLDLALIGTPKGWRSYATRSHSRSGMTAIDDEFDVAVEHAGTKDITFLVVGGSRKIAEAVKERGYLWAPEFIETRNGRAQEYTN